MQIRIEYIFLGLVLLLSFSCVASEKKQKDKKQPNLLIIHTDEHNFRTLGCYRNTLTDEQAFMWGEGNIVKTPHIDELAKKGALCTSFYANTPACSPSRSSFVSGKYPQNTPVVANNVRMDDDVITFAHVLQKEGYKTGYAGKWHLDGNGKPQWEPERNFGFEDNRFMYNRGHYKKVENTENGPRIVPRNEKGEGTYDVDGADEKSFMTDFLTDQTIEFIQKNKDESFCYMVSYPDPHGPNTVRAPYDTMYEHMDFKMPHTAFKDTTGLPGWSKKKSLKLNQAGMARYFGMVKCIDDNVGRLINLLKKEKLLENTIIVFTSDHGDLLGEHARIDKFVTYEASAKVPFIVYYPEKVVKGIIINQALSCVDFQPTILGLMEINQAGTEEGRDASELFTTNTNPENWKDITFMRGSDYDRNNAPSSWIAAFTDRYKLVYSTSEDYKPWLYDLNVDPDEVVNFYDDPDYQEVAKFLAVELKGYCLKYNDKRYELKSIKDKVEKLIDN